MKTACEVVTQKRQIQLEAVKTTGKTQKVKRTKRVNLRKKQEKNIKKTAKFKRKRKLFRNQLTIQSSLERSKLNQISKKSNLSLKFTMQQLMQGRIQLHTFERSLRQQSQYSSRNRCTWLRCTTTCARKRSRMRSKSLDFQNTSHPKRKS